MNQRKFFFSFKKIKITIFNMEYCPKNIKLFLEKELTLKSYDLDIVEYDVK